jgi:Glu-tRNA(Gln) amidotransferase subunit E-like FAD-binding protein
MSDLTKELEEYSVTILKKIAKEGGLKGYSSLNKNPLIKKLIDNITSQKLNFIRKNHLKIQKPAKKKSITKQKINMTLIQENLTNIENRINHNLSRIERLEAKFAEFMGSDLNYDESQVYGIANYLKNLIKPGNSMTLDEIKENGKLRKYSWHLIEKSIRNLIDEEVFDGTEAISRLKIDDSIGRIIRRKDL